MTSNANKIRCAGLIGEREEKEGSGLTFSCRMRKASEREEFSRK